MCASGTSINETETVSSLSHLGPPQDLCQNRVLGSGICPIRLLSAGVAGPAPPFVPRSAQEGGCQTGGIGSEHHREPCPVLNPVP